MKLISVKILGQNFRSLAANKLYQFNVTQRKSRLSPKIFAGLNGSGKSNFLELMAEIFFYLEKYHMEHVPAVEKKAIDIGFEIEYIMPLKGIRNSLGEISFGNEGCHVRIIKPLNEFPEFSYCKYGEQQFIRRDIDTKALLPSKVIAYTSGQNELLSNPFYKIRYHYFKETEKGKSVENDKFFFLDSNSNFSIFVANMLLAPIGKLNYIKEIFNVESLHSFRITINMVDYRKQKIRLSDTVLEYIEKFKCCSTSWIRLKNGKEDLIILDYRVASATREAFRFHFKSTFNLFRAFYEIDNLNLNLVPVDTRGLILKAHKSLNISDELPRPDPSRLIFRIEKIQLNKNIQEGKPAKAVYYKGLSDGEHQFNEVTGSMLMMEQEGCLYLMDEPDTHFNPVWRAKLVEILNYMAAYNFDAKGKPVIVRNHEIIITTHSPFVISDSMREDVYKFDKVNGEVLYINPKIETYGASVSLLLQEIFDRRISISDLANSDIDELRDALKELQSPEARKAKIEETKSKLLNFGESIEKFDLYSLLRQIEKEIGGIK